MPTNPFITAHTSDEAVASLVEVGFPLMGNDGRVKDSAMLERVSGIKYSRAWLILRHEWLTKFNPEGFVPLATMVADATKQATQQKRLAEFNADRDVVAKVVQDLRDDLQYSWGEISVRCGIPESAVRRCYRLTAGKKDRGLRIGKGGRFAYDEPTLYLENMKVEGAHIPTDLKMRPQREDCLNFVKKDQPVKAARKPRAKKVAAAA